MIDVNFYVIKKEDFFSMLFFTFLRTQNRKQKESIDLYQWLPSVIEGDRYVFAVSGVYGVSLYEETSIYSSVVQPCRHSPHVATGRFSRNGFIVKKSTKLLFYSIFLQIVATAKTLSPQKWRMWRQGSFWLDNADLQ